MGGLRGARPEDCWGTAWAYGAGARACVRAGFVWPRLVRAIACRRLPRVSVSAPLTSYRGPRAADTGCFGWRDYCTTWDLGCGLVRAPCAYALPASIAASLCLVASTDAPRVGPPSSLSHQETALTGLERRWSVPRRPKGWAPVFPLCLASGFTAWLSSGGVPLLLSSLKVVASCLAGWGTARPACAGVVGVHAGVHALAVGPGGACRASTGWAARRPPFHQPMQWVPPGFLDWSPCWAGPLAAPHRSFSPNTTRILAT